MKVPFFRPDVGEAEAVAVADAVRSATLAGGPRVSRFEAEFARAVGARHAVAVGSRTAALELALEALGVRPGDGVLVPTMTFAPTAGAVVRVGAVPILVDCDMRASSMDLDDAARKIDALRSRRLESKIPKGTPVVGIVPVHVAGHMMNADAVDLFARDNRLWVVEDAAHAFPAAYRSHRHAPWRRCGGGTSAVACFSFRAGAPITTGEGGMAVTDRADLADRIRRRAGHGITPELAARSEGIDDWDYRIVGPGRSDAMSELAAALGLVQLARADEMREAREIVARRYLSALADLDAIELPPSDGKRLHAWQGFRIQLRLDRLSIDRAAFVAALRSAGVFASVHWRPLHLHPFYRGEFGWAPTDFPVATAAWPRLVSLPIFSGQSDLEADEVVRVVRSLCLEHARGVSRARKRGSA